MKTTFSTTWNHSKQPRKQRKFVKNAPLHIKRKVLLSAHLSKELQNQYGRRTISLRRGDKVRVLRGDFKGKTGVVDSISIVRGTIRIRGVEVVKKDGTKIMKSIPASNLEIIDISFDDPERRKIVDRKVNHNSKSPVKADKKKEETKKGKEENKENN